MSRRKSKINSSGPAKLSRRSLLVLSIISCAGLIFKPFQELFASDSNNAHSGVTSTIENDKLKFFNWEEAFLVDEISSHIIPSDDYPGAREAGVVYEIDGMVAASNQDKGIYTRGLKVLDNMAIKIFSKKGFAALNRSEKIKLLKAAEKGNIGGLAGEKIQIDARAVRTAIIFFGLIKKHTFEAFYSGSLGWQIAGYSGPPQWKGKQVHIN